MKKNSLITSNFHYNFLISLKTHENENSPMLANLIHTTQTICGVTKAHMNPFPPISCYDSLNKKI